MTAIRARMGSILLITAMLAGLFSCGGTLQVDDDTPTMPRTAAAYPYTLQAPSRLPHDFVWRQVVEARFGARTERFEAVVEKKGDNLVLIGFTPFGTKAFALTMKGTEVSFRAFIDQELPFSPHFMLIDIQRAFWPIAETASKDGVRTLHSGEEEVAETWREGRLVTRRFTRPGGPHKGHISVRYLRWFEGETTPQVVELTNGWFGYSLQVTTIEARPL